MNTPHDENGQLKLHPVKDEEGQMLVMVALSMMLFLAFLALAVNVGLLFRARRNLQIAADGAATAAALDYYYNSSNAGAIAAADAVGANAAGLNGVTAGNGTTVDVHCPVQNGAYTSSTCTGYFEAVLVQPNPTILMGMFTQSSTMNVAARAVAGTPYVATDCIYILNSLGDIGAGGGTNSGVGKKTPGHGASMWLQGSFTVKANKCGIVDDGTSSDALDLNGGGTLSAGSISVVGNCQGCAPPPYTSGVAPVSNPLKALCVPDSDTAATCPLPSSCSSGGSFGGTASAPLVIGSGGTVCYSGDSSGNLTLTNVTLDGTFIFTGRGTLTFGGNVNSDPTDGSTIDLAYGGTNANTAMTENSGTVFNLNAPTASTSAYQGIILMAPNTNASIVEFDFGSSSGTLTGAVNGIIYLPAAALFLHDSGGDHSGGLTLNTDLIVGELDDVTASLTINSYSTSNPTLTPLKAVALVE